MTSAYKVDKIDIMKTIRIGKAVLPLITELLEDAIWDDEEMIRWGKDQGVRHLDQYSREQYDSAKKRLPELKKVRDQLHA